MATFEHTVVIRRAPQTVFDFLTAPENNTAWQPTLVGAVAVTPGPVCVGWRFRESRRVLGRVIETEFEVQQCDPPGYVEILAVTGLARIRASYLLLARRGATVLTAAGEIADCMLGRLATNALTRTARGELETSLVELRRILERAPSLAGSR
jgi:hypothetical protein